MKSKFKGALALTMALSLAFSSMGVNAFAKDNVVVTLAEEAGFEFGSSDVKLSEGSYKLPLAMMKSTDITADSMAKSCIKDAYLTVDKNGKAKIKVNLQAVSMIGITDWAKDWKIYSSSLGSDLTAAEFTTNSEGNVDSITFELPDNSFDGVYANMFITAMASTQDCYFKLDFANAEKVFAFGSDNTYLKAGEYDLTAKLKNASNIANDSMAASCIKGAKLSIKDNGEAIVKVNLQAVTVGSISGWAKDWQIYASDTKSEKTAAEFTTDAEGNVDSISYVLADRAVDGTYINMYIDVMGYSPDAYIAYDWSSAEEGEKVYNGSFHIDQFGEYDINTAVSVKNDVITNVDITGANFSGTHADYNKYKLSTAISGMVDKLLGKSAKDAKGIYELDAVSEATYSSKGIKSSVMNALDLKYEEEVINLPTQKLEKGEYTVDISFYTDNVTHYLTEDEKASAKIKVDADGNMTLVTDIINGTKKEPLYLTEFNGYYPDNDLSKELVKDNMSITKGDISYSDTYFKEGTQVVTELQMPLVGDFAKIYNSNAHIYVPAMNNLNGEAGGVYFENGWFDTDCFLKVYWDSLTKVASDDEDKKGYGSEGTELAEGKYSVPLSMKNASDISKDSMAASCIKGAELEIKADKSAEITVDLQAVTVTMYGQTVTSWAKDWKYYNGTSTSADLVDMEATKDADGNVVKAKFKVPDNNADGVYVNMNSGRNASDAYFAIDYKNAKKITNGYGSEKTELAEGKYSVPLSMKNASDISKDSMAASCIKGAELEIKADKSAEITVDLQAVTITMFGQTVTSWAKDWKYYDGTSTSAILVDMEETKDDDGNVVKAKFKVPDNSADGVYVNMNSGRNASDAYFAIDYKNAKKINDEVGFGSSNTILKAGRYSIPVDMKNASNLSQGSMAASCLNGAELVVDENGKAKLTVKLKAVTVGPIVDWAEQWKVYTDGVSSELITAEYTTNAEDKVDSFTFDILDNSKDGTYVQMYVAAMGYAADAYLAIDYANAKEVQEILYGDVDGNGKVELADAELLLKYVLDADNTQISEEGLKNARVSGSETLTATEAAMIRLKALNNDYKFPVEK